MSEPNDRDRQVARAATHPVSRIMADVAVIAAYREEIQAETEKRLKHEHECYNDRRNELDAEARTVLRDRAEQAERERDEAQAQLKEQEAMVGAAGEWLQRAEMAGAQVRELQDLVARLKLEAQIHAQEARTQASIVRECYQIASGATGEPGDWHGAEPVRRMAERVKELEERLRELPDRMWAARSKQVGLGTWYSESAQWCVDWLRKDVGR